MRYIGASDQTAKEVKIFGKEFGQDKHYGHVDMLIGKTAPKDVWPLGALGYRQALGVVEGRLTREEAIEETTVRTRQYAKRQRTWFRRQEPEVRWIDEFGDAVDPRSRGLLSL